MAGLLNQEMAYYEMEMGHYTMPFALLNPLTVFRENRTARRKIERKQLLINCWEMSILSLMTILFLKIITERLKNY
jgi:hypothetical protein